jgi:hypothetical protein
MDGRQPQQAGPRARRVGRVVGHQRRWVDADRPGLLHHTDRSGEQANWFLTLEQPTEEFWGGDVPPALVSAEKVPGADAHVWITVAADGAISVEPGRGAPPDEELAVDHCMMGSRP